MSYFDQCADLGDRGVELVLRWLASRGKVFESRIVRTDKGRLSLSLQTTVGDLLYNSNRLTIMSIEVKTEARWTGNFFFETWSNACPGRERPGWMKTLDADWLFYYFWEVDALYVCDFQKLKTWAFKTDRLRHFPEKAFGNGNGQQLNNTLGVVVPVSVLQAELNLHEFHPLRELGLPLDAA